MPHVFEVADRIMFTTRYETMGLIQKYEMSDAVAFMTGAKEPPKINLVKYNQLQYYF